MPQVLLLLGFWSCRPAAIDGVPPATLAHAGYRYRICARSHLTADGSAHHTGSLVTPLHDFVGSDRACRVPVFGGQQALQLARNSF